MNITEVLNEDQLRQASQFIANEHAALQSGRSSTVFEANGRTGIFLSSVSTTLVALALVGQVSGLSQPFYIFSLILFPCLFFIGVVTFHRTLQSNIEDLVYDLGLIRLRHFYIEVVPELKNYLILTTNDDLRYYRGPVTTLELNVRPSWWQMFLTNSGMIAIINSVLAGVFGGLVIGAFALPFFVSIGCGLVVFVASEIVHFLSQARVWNKFRKGYKPLFPN
jgi:hypothetical protein